MVEEGGGEMASSCDEYVVLLQTTVLQREKNGQTYHVKWREGKSTYEAHSTCQRCIDILTKRNGRALFNWMPSSFSIVMTKLVSSCPSNILFLVHFYVFSTQPRCLAHR